MKGGGQASLSAIPATVDWSMFVGIGQYWSVLVSIGQYLSDESVFVDRGA